MRAKLGLGLGLGLGLRLGLGLGLGLGLIKVRVRVRFRVVIEPLRTSRPGCRQIHRTTWLFPVPPIRSIQNHEFVPQSDPYKTMNLNQSETTFTNAQDHTKDGTKRP